VPRRGWGRVQRELETTVGSQIPFRVCSESARAGREQWTHRRAGLKNAGIDQANFHNYATVFCAYILLLRHRADLAISMDNLEDVVRLRRELAQSIHLADDAAVRRAYQDLLRAGCSRKEIVDELITLAAASQYRPQRASENSAPSGLRASEDERRSKVSEHENYRIERVAAHLSLDTAIPTAPAPAIEGRVDGDGRWAASLSRLKWAMMFAFIGASASVAGAGGYLVFMDREDIQLGATADIPPAAIQEPLASDHAGPAPEMQVIGSPARSENAAGDPPKIKAASAQASSPRGIGSPSPGMMPVVIPAQERSKEVLPPAAPAVGDVTASNNPPTKASSDPTLLARGDGLFAAGDLASARFFYERAANAGNAQAALRLGQTYDPAFLAQIKAKGVQSDASAAVHWYLQADKLGAPEAALMLRGMANELGISAPAQRQGSQP
jgi:hypothetical protein